MIKSVFTALLLAAPAVASATSVPTQDVGSWVDRVTYEKFTSTSNTSGDPCSRIQMVTDQDGTRETYNTLLQIGADGKVSVPMIMPPPGFNFPDPGATIDSQGAITFSAAFLKAMADNMKSTGDMPADAQDFSFHYVMDIKSGAKEGVLHTFVQGTNSGKASSFEADPQDIVSVPPVTFSAIVNQVNLCERSLAK